MPRGDNAGAPRKHNNREPISLDVSEDDSKALSLEVKTKTRSNGKHTRKPGQNRRTPEDDAPNPQFALDGGVGQDATQAASAPPESAKGEGASAASDVLSVRLPMLSELKPGDIVGASDADVAVYQTFHVSRAESHLTTTQRVAIEMFADMMNSYSVQQVAAAVGVDHTTLYSWLRNPVFTTAMELRTRENFINVGWQKLFHVYNRGLNKNTPGSRVLEQVAKSLGLFSDADNINIQVNVEANTEQRGLDAESEGDY